MMFPFSRPELLKEWVLNIGRGNFQPKQHTVICSEHFRPECFSAFGNRKNLKHNAVPTEFAFQDARQAAQRRPKTFPAEAAAELRSDLFLVASQGLGICDQGPEAATAIQHRSLEVLLVPRVLAESSR
ncbi:THAP domain-containing protein 3 [Myotis brandtii]|uniref:THAP domain-containing protein 3 n=1 Tax=Myotis brandtii TaxID=109478 RepID=S7PW37_MYOBR|nr:THAP domain-containing protein 3 [Myotis brandtii]